MQLRHYRGIGSRDVPLGQPTFPIGPNGSGKSNRSRIGAAYWVVERWLS